MLYVLPIEHNLGLAWKGGWLVGVYPLVYKVNWQKCTRRQLGASLRDGKQNPKA